MLNTGATSPLHLPDGLCQACLDCPHCRGSRMVDCANFPYKFVRTPAGIFAGLAFACPAVLACSGLPVTEQREELEAIANAAISRPTVAEPLALTEDLPLSWEQYAEIEEDLIGLLDPAQGPLGQRLVAQTVYLRLLIDFLRQARGQAGAMVAGPEANAEALAVFRRRLHAEGDGLPALLRRAAAPRPVSPLLRRSILGFAHTLLAADVQNTGRWAAYLKVTTQYLLFAAGHGTLRPPATAPVAYDRLRQVAFDPTRPELDELLTRYFRHRLFRKDLALAETVRAGLHLQLLAWGLIHCHAAARAAAAGARAVGLDPLREGVRAVEERMFPDPALAIPFRRYPLLRGVLDRLFLNPLYPYALGWSEGEKN